MSREVGQAVEVQFQLEQLEPGWPPTSVEAIWCVPADGVDDGYRVTNVPIHVLDIARDDVISVKPSEAGPLEFVGVLRRSGHSTLRVIVADLMDTDAVAEALGDLGAVVQNTYISQLLAVDLPSTIDFTAIRVWLIDAEGADRLDWEEGYLADGHRVLH